MNTDAACYFKSCRDIVKIQSSGNICFKKIVLLINSSTISSAELLTISLKENANTIILGDKSYGKSIVLAQYSIDNSLMMSIPKYYFLSPSMKNINNIGITPDIYMTNEQIDSIINSNSLEEFINI